MNIKVNINISISNEDIEQFKKDCKLIYLDREYNGFIGDQRWAIITDLSEEELRRKYVDVLGKYIPYILLSKAQGEPILESIRNNHKHEIRSKRTTEPFDYDDELLPLFHSELLSFVDPLEEKEKIIERLKEEHALDELIIKVQSVYEQIIINATILHPFFYVFIQQYLYIFIANLNKPFLRPFSVYFDYIFS